MFTSKKFKSSSGANGIKCNLKTAEGFLYPLDKAFMFVPKPTQYIPFKVRTRSVRRDGSSCRSTAHQRLLACILSPVWQEVESVNFERVPTGSMGELPPTHTTRMA